MAEDKSCIKFPTDDSRDEIIITSMRVLIAIMESLGGFVNTNMIKSYGDDWFNQLPVYGYESGKGRIQKPEQIFDISTFATEVCNNSTSMFRDCFKGYDDYEKRKIYEHLWKVKKIRDGVVHNSISQTTLLIDLCEEVDKLFYFLRLKLCFNPGSLIIRVNELLVGVKFGNEADNSISEDERKALDMIISEAEVENKKLSEQVDLQTRIVTDLMKEISILKSAGELDKLEKAKSQYTDAVSRRNDAILDKNTYTGKKSIADEFMSTYFNVEDFEKLLDAFAQINDSTNGYEIGDSYVLPSLIKKIKLTVPVSTNKIILKEGASGIDYLTIKESELYLLFRSLRPEGGTFFIDANFEVFFPYKDERKEIVFNKYVYAGNLGKCLLFL